MNLQSALDVGVQSKSTRLRWCRIMRVWLLFKDWNHDNRRSLLVREISFAFLRQKGRQRGVCTVMRCMILNKGFRVKVCVDCSGFDWVMFYPKGCTMLPVHIKHLWVFDHGWNAEGWYIIAYSHAVEMVWHLGCQRLLPRSRHVLILVRKWRTWQQMYLHLHFSSW